MHITELPMISTVPQPEIILSKLRDIGWALWDPIGLLDPKNRSGRWEDETNLPFADEYDSYLLEAASKLRWGTPRGEIVEFLIKVEAEHMGLGDRSSARSRAGAVVEAILADQTIWTWPDDQARFDQTV